MTKPSQNGFLNYTYRGLQYQDVNYSLETPEGKSVEYCGAWLSYNIYHGSKNEISQDPLYFQKSYSEEFHCRIKKSEKKEKKNVKKNEKRKRKRK